MRVVDRCQLWSEQVKGLARDPAGQELMSRSLGLPLNEVPGHAFGVQDGDRSWAAPVDLSVLGLNKPSMDVDTIFDVPDYMRKPIRTPALRPRPLRR